MVKSEQDYASFLFKPFVIIVTLAVLSLLIHLLPKLFPATQKDFIIALLQSFTTLVAVFFGWQLARAGEKEKQKNEIDLRINAIMSEIYDLVVPMKRASIHKVKRAKEIVNKNTPTSTNIPTILLTQSTPAYQEHFKYIIPFISINQRQNIRALYNLLESYNQVSEELKIRTDKGFDNPHVEALNHYTCAQLANEVHLLCLWMKERDPNTAFDYSSTFFTANKLDIYKDLAEIFPSKAN